jgi:hypothetical protein
MLTWLMGAWLIYHGIAATFYYQAAAPVTPEALEAFFHGSKYVLKAGDLIGTTGPVFVVTYGALVTLVILIALYMEMGRVARYGLSQNFSGSQFDLYGSIFLLVVCCIEWFFLTIAQTSLFVILLFASVMDVLVHVRFLHHFVKGRKNGR